MCFTPLKHGCMVYLHRMLAVDKMIVQLMENAVAHLDQSIQYSSTFLKSIMHSNGGDNRPWPYTVRY